MKKTEKSKWEEDEMGVHKIGVDEVEGRLCS